MKTSRIPLPAVALLTALSGLGFASATSAPAETSTSCPDDAGTLTVDEADGAQVDECDLEGRKIVEDALSVVVPQPGDWVVAEIAVDDGYEGTTALDVAVSDDGTLSVDPDPGTPRETGGAACEQLDYSTFGHSWAGRTINWRINISSIPNPDLTDADAIAAIRQGLQNWGFLNNNCGQADNVTINGSYNGDTTLLPNAGTGGGCAAGNGNSTAGFGPMTTGLQAVACIYGGTSATEGDIKFDNSYRQWTVTAGGSCSNEYDLESVATHEWGHILGMAHNPSGTAQTMWRSMPDCSVYRRTLGIGDITGIRTKY